MIDIANKYINPQHRYLSFRCRWMRIALYIKYERFPLLMKPVYYVIDAANMNKLSANIRPATEKDFLKTEQDHWQTSWMSEFIQDTALEKYALEIRETN